MHPFKITEDLLSDLTALATAYLDPKGREIPNPKPLVLHTKLNRPLTLQEQIERVFKGRLSDQAQRQGYETLEESQDFDMDDDFDRFDESIYQVIDEEVPTPRGPAPGDTMETPNTLHVEPETEPQATPEKLA